MTNDQSFNIIEKPCDNAYPIGITSTGTTVTANVSQVYISLSGRYSTTKLYNKNATHIIELYNIHKRPVRLSRSLISDNLISAV